MSDGHTPPRSAQADELIAAVNRNSVACAALAAAIGALVIAVDRNADALYEALALDAEDDDAEHAEDCEDDDCGGECLDEPEPTRRKQRARKRT